MTIERKHGCPYDRGRADSYYWRDYSPHYWPDGTGNGVKITVLTDDELQEYRKGFDENEDFGHHKDWGQLMPLGITKRNRIKLRADKVWCSVWHRQMLYDVRGSKAIDNPVVPLSYGVTNKLTATVGWSDTRNTGD